MREMQRVAALFVHKDGPYGHMDGVDFWGIEQDARKYDGGHPVVAHPPCARWGKLAPINHARWGTPIGEDDGCFESALSSLRRCGGVLEHPAGSIAYRHFNLQKPKGNFWNKCGDNEWVGEVYQSIYGHRATKKTWLYYVGDREPIEFTTGRKKGTHQVGGGVNTGHNQKPRLPSSESHLTPILFAEYLVALARHSKGDSK